MTVRRNFAGVYRVYKCDCAYLILGPDIFVSDLVVEFEQFYHYCSVNN